MKNSKLYTPNDELRCKTITTNTGLEEEHYRTPWRRDYARLIHSASFRRLQGKTQLFPYFESDFFRNRLTHSLEVAQISKSIAIRLNNTNKFFKKNNINEDICEFAGLAHDLGHPPFGHNGEYALDECMRNYGGFEGNAQTLRILTKIEKKSADTEVEATGRVIENGNDLRLGLDLTYRSIASILKYDKQIPKKRKNGDGQVVKGYYYSEKNIVEEIKSKILGTRNNKDILKTVECQIMDIADDIAYSTYDLEDAFKAGFIKPLDMISVSGRIAQEIAKEVSNALHIRFTEKDLKDCIFTFFEGLFKQIFEGTKDYIDKENFKSGVTLVDSIYKGTKSIAEDGYLRTQFSSELIATFVQSIEVNVNKNKPILSEIKLNDDKRKLVESLKRFTYIYLISSPILKVSRYRASEIITTIFDALSDDKNQGYELLPLDYQYLYLSFNKKEDRMRVICDFIAGMTDRYVLEFYGRLKSENPETIFKPI